MQNNYNINILKIIQNKMILGREMENMSIGNLFMWEKPDITIMPVNVVIVFVSFINLWAKC